MVAVNDGSAVQYLLTDHLGSTVAVTNSSGTLTSQQRYLPFGGTRAIPNSPILGTDFGYTGQRLLDSGMGGIMDYKARFYSVGLGRFVQPDTIIPDQSNPQSWNRFSYVTNRPIILNDPDGHCAPVCAVPLIIVAVAVVAVTAIFYATVPPPHVLGMGQRAHNRGIYFPQIRFTVPKITPIIPKFKGPGSCLDSWKRFGVCGIIVAGLLEIGKNLLRCGMELCPPDQTPPTQQPSATQTAPSITDTPTPSEETSCPPFIQCPNTSVPSPNTPTLTPPTTSTQTPENSSQPSSMPDLPVTPAPDNRTRIHIPI